MENLNKNKSKNKVICVLGMHRSGTSLATKLLNICGVYIGEEGELVGPSEGNKKGHWESNEVLEINTEIMELFGGSWDNPPILEKGWEKNNRLDKLYSRADSFVEKMNKKSSVWGFKDPRTCITLPFWERVVGDMKYVILVRDPIEVANSLKKRNKFNIERGLIIWSRYWLDIFKYTKNKDRVFVFFKNYFTDWRGETKKIVDFIDEEKITHKGKESKIEEFISSGLRHNINQEMDSRLLFSDDDIERWIIEKIQENIRDFSVAPNQCFEDLREAEKVIVAKTKEIKEKAKEIREKNNKILLLETSKFFKLRRSYMKFKGLTFSKPKGSNNENKVKNTKEQKSVTKIKAEEVDDTKKELPMVSLDLSRQEMRKHFAIVDKKNKENINSINWLIPSVQHVLFGGIYTILRFANYFQKKGIKTKIIVYGGTEDNFEKIRKQANIYFSNINKEMFYLFRGEVNDIPESDAVVSTLWNSCFISAKFNKTKKKFYFIQDYEPLFFTAGSERYNLSELTYRLGFRGIVNTPGLAKYVEREHGMKDYEFFYPAVDRNIYNISSEEIKNKISRKKIKIVFYGRPGNDRNAFQVGLDALLKVKDKYGDGVEIISVGAEWNEEDYGAKDKITNLGRLGSLEEVAELYRDSDIGLVFMFTKHPSYQPFEYMSCGCAVATNYNSDNLWFLKDRENCLLFEPTTSCIYESISELIENPQLRKKIITKGLESVSENKWEDQCKKIFDYIND